MASQTTSRVFFYCIFCTFLFCTLIHGAESGVNEKNEEDKSLPAICGRKCKKNINSTIVAGFCSNSSDKELHGRCCVNTTDKTILGIDLENCNMTRAIFSNGIQNLADLSYISLQENDGLKQVTREDFQRNTHIQYLALPLDMNCPGHADSWRHITNNTKKDVIICEGELDVCHVYNVSCPENSHCVHSGVDLTECLCDDGFHGYKCMNQGTFPVLPFVLGVAIPSVIICILLWVTQRRYVKTNNKNK